jgi:hypothetical protein
MGSPPSPGGLGPVWPSQSAGFGQDNHGWITGAQLRGRVHTRQAADLFQPVTDVQPPAAPTDQSMAPPNDVNKQSQPCCAPVSRSESASGVRRVSPGARLVGGSSGAVTTVMASALLVVITGGITLAMTSSDESSPADLSPDRLPTSAIPAMDDKPLIVSSLDRSARFAGQTPDAVSSPQPAAAPAHRPPISTIRHDTPAVAPPAPHHPPLPSPPPAPLSPGTNNDAEFWMFSGSFAGNRESPTTDTGPCHCDAVMRTIPGHRNDRTPQTGHPHDPRSAQQPQHRSTNATSQPTTSEQENNDTQSAPPDGQATPRPFPSREY